MKTLTLDIADRIIGAALAHADAAAYRPMAVVVLDESGNLKAARRADGASMFRCDIATAKAWGAVAMGSSSRQLAERAAGNPNFFLSLAATSNGRFLCQPGAVLIRAADGEIIGAVGASGGTGEEDEAICLAGVAAAGMRSDRA